MALEFFIRNLCKEIIYECKKDDIECHNDFLYYYLNLLSFDPLWNLHPKMKVIIRNDALRLIKFVVAKMKHQECPCIIALKIQMYFSCNFKEKSHIINSERNNLRTRLKPLEDEILEYTGLFADVDKVDVVMLRKKILFYITLLRGLGNPSLPAVYQEASYAFYSIIDDGDLADFIMKSVDDKLNDLHHISLTYSGVRIFNWSCKKGGDGIENLPILLHELIEEMKKNINEVMKTTMDKIDILTAALEMAFVLVELKEKVKEEIVVSYKLECEVPYEFDYEDVEYAKDLLVVFRQLEMFLRELMKATDLIERSAGNLDKEFNNSINHFHSLVYLKVGIPTNVVFPVFITLGKIWERYQDEIIHITKLKQMLRNLEIYLKDLILNIDFVNEIIGEKEFAFNRKLEEYEVMPQEENIKENMKESITSCGSRDREKSVPVIKLEFLGCCPWKLVETQGALIPGDSQYGVMQYKDKFYVFSCAEASHNFYKSPDQYIYEVLELARKKPELISLLRLEDSLRAVQTIKELTVEQKKLEALEIVKNDAGVQTELHPIESIIQPDYKSNIWDWKRQAICFADISSRVTKHTQTEKSGTRNAVQTQTYEMREKTCQTRHDNYTNTNQPQTYFFGLKGRNDDKQFILDLTRPIEK